MPTYEYRCKECGEHLEVVQSFRDDALTACPKCGGPLRKVFGAIGVVFKGTGFYKTDSRTKPDKVKATSGSDAGGKAGITNTDAAGSSSSSDGPKSSDAASSASSKPDTTTSTSSSGTGSSSAGAA